MLLFSCHFGEAQGFPDPSHGIAHKQWLRMGFIRDDIYQMIQRSDKLKDDERLSIFESLSQKFSLIPLRGGFASPIEASGDPDEMKRMAKKLKRPIENGWQKWCETIRQFNRQDFKADRAGIACGPASGVLVLDIDDIDKFWKVLEFNGIDPMLPPTFAVKTGGRGERYHYYFRYPNDGKKYSCRSKAKCFDVRGTGGQVICPGSLHPETQKPYIIATNEDILDAPNWLLEYSSGAREIFTEEEQDRRSKKILPPASRNISSEIEPLEDKLVNLDGFIERLSVSEDIKQKIMTPFPQGTRSEPSWSVLLGLLNASIDERTIRSIYQSYPIGERSREKPDWFERELEAAKKTIAQNPIGVTMQLGFQSGSNASASDSDYGIFNAYDVLTAQTNFEFLIDNFWPKDEPLLITGYGGAGKSVLTLQIAMDLVYPPTNGFLNKFKVLHGGHRVLFVQSENSLVGMKRRLELIRGAYAIPDDVIRERLFFVGRKNDIRASGDLDSQQFQDIIKRQYDLLGFDILVVDPLISFHNKDENSNDEMRKLLDNFSDFCEGLKVSPLIIHHHGKFKQERGVGGGRGASAIGDWSPNTWELEYKETVKRFKFIHKKARNFMLNDDLSLELSNLRFNVSIQSGNLNNDTVYYVIKALQNLNGVAQTQTVLKNEVVNVYKTENPNKSITAVTAVKYISAAVGKKAIKTIPGAKGSISYQL
ncbi:AAA family ATPase [Desulfovibrio sp. TomC]|uniref:AAA family ATPase n=1 Tax=Desulfovibrio sp. TomC TaxID=1562888 RepID=UPI0005753E28|nr:AAA family ATPase [Desulfovibrio sp. TomC]KHK00236.1 hypothetical protein NY78_4351 [Desulfovibrio sp. TomC]